MTEEKAVYNAEELKGKTKEALEAYRLELASYRMPELDAVAMVGVCLNHDGAFQVVRVNDTGLTVEGVKYANGDRVQSIPKHRRAAYANSFANRNLIPDYILDQRRKYDAMKGYYQNKVESAIKAIDEAEQELERGRLMGLAAKAQIENAERMERDGAEHLQAAFVQALEALDFRPE